MPSSIRRILHRLALFGERAIDLVWVRTSEDRIVEAYAGHSTPDHLIVRGRVLTSLRRNKPLPQQSKLTNFRQMMSLFLTDEVENVTVHARGETAQTTEEGYFEIAVPRGMETGWVDIAVNIEGRVGETICPVLVPSPDAEFMVISDIDDTVLETGAYSLLRNLWTSLTGNALTRRVFPDSVNLLQNLSSGGTNPVYYVSSSPWNLYNFLLEIFDSARLVQGPMFLRDLGLSETKFITEGHGGHKGASINKLIDFSPQLPVILIGDTGQKDAIIYRKVIERYPGRIKAVILREPDPGGVLGDLQDIEALKETGVQVFHGPDFSGFNKSDLSKFDLKS